MLSVIINGRLLLLGFMFTCTNTYKLSLALTATLTLSAVAMPSTFNLKDEVAPPISLTLLNCILLLLGLKILNDSIIEPAEVKTVSKLNVSALILTNAWEFVMKSFLQENKIIAEI